MMVVVPVIVYFWWPAFLIRFAWTCFNTIILLGAQCIYCLALIPNNYGFPACSLGVDRGSTGFHN